MKTVGIDAASPRTLHFKCESCDYSTDEHQTLARMTESKLKRQRSMKTSVVKVHLVELIRDLDKANEETDKHYGLFVWPSALLLSQFVAHEADSLCRDKVVLELGCGTGLPSILASLCGATKVYLTDRPGAPDIQCNAETNIRLNGIEDRAEFISLAWGDMHVSDAILSVFQTVQVILAADCFYQSKDFEKVLATVALVCRCSLSSSCTFYFTYQLRSLNESIAPLLSRWGLVAKSIATSNLPFDKNFDSDQAVNNIYLYQVNAQF
ncbi:unnamed protein product [Peronospora belbahrii]|uniref:Uncharacterized protein n=1 Tax=Peronospora belbahrii TaxID=622444 RepID=A0AAU9KM70_9STRA|nr:unnamed protein product [Peronospora belbahrii]CAH0515172.1 unnamed protein product [Peronospora belbahrii]